MNALRETTHTLFKRYAEIIQEQNGSEDPMRDDERLSLENLLWICQEALENADTLPLDKLSRWLGFVQGCLCMRRLIDVDAERYLSRPLFHAAYAAEGIQVPTKRER